MKEIKLTRGKVALVDDADYDYLSKYNWFAVKDGKRFYAMRNIMTPMGKKKLYMHRELLGVGAKDIDVVVDHKDHDGLNNQRHNIRLCTRSMNLWNTLPKASASFYKGASWSNGAWNCSINLKGKRIHIGRFNRDYQAAVAYDLAVKEHHGEFGYLNFKNIGGING